MCETDEAMIADIRARAYSVFHPCGSCRMGPDPRDAVVDARLKVHGLDGLRIVDASIFPLVPSGNTNAPAMMVGERGGDLHPRRRRKPPETARPCGVRSPWDGFWRVWPGRRGGWGRWGRVGVVGAAFDDFEEEAVGKVRGVDLEIFAAGGVAVVEDAADAQPFDELVVEGEAGDQVLVIVLGDRQRREAAGLQGGGGREDVAGRERDVLGAGAEELALRKRPERVRRLWEALRTMRRAPSRVATTCCGSAARIGDVLPRRLLDVEDRGIIEEPRQHLVVVHGLGEMVDADEAGVGRVRLGRVGGSTGSKSTSRQRARSVSSTK